MKTKIFVMTHKKFIPPQEDIYIPLHVGKALGKDFGYLGDDTGDSISNLNPYYGELTGLYWIWKNEKEADIVGICHYRRYFVDVQRRLLTKELYEAELEDADVITSNAVYTEEAYKEEYAKAHYIKDLLATGEVIKALYPQDYPVFCQVIEGNKNYYGNLCVMRKETFDAYCEWLFTIFFELEGRVDVSGYDDYHKRLFGFLSEELLLVYIMARNLRVKEGNIMISAEKAETVEFKAAMGQLIKMGEFSQARSMFYEYLKIRPDIQLELSDILGEIPDIELILYILEQEQINGIGGFYQVSDKLNELILHLRNVKKIAKKKKENIEISEEDKIYLSEKKVSDIAWEIVGINL